MTMAVTLLSGGVGGARLARGFEALPDVALTVVVNVGDDQVTHGLAVSPDVDTVVYTLAGLEGEQGWGRRGDTFNLNDELPRFGLSNTFKLGDRDLALKLYRTLRLSQGDLLSQITADIVAMFGIRSAVLPATDDPVPTEVLSDDGEWISFQEYFVHRRHRDTVVQVRFIGAEAAAPAPGVIGSIAEADLMVIAPSNPPLSIWPILSIPGVRQAVAERKDAVAVSPLVEGKPVKGPVDRVLDSLGYAPGDQGVADAYQGLIRRLVVDGTGPVHGVETQRTTTAMPNLAASTELARAILEA